jgi:hypothetical protein
VQILSGQHQAGEYLHSSSLEGAAIGGERGAAALASQLSIRSL